MKPVKQHRRKSARIILRFLMTQLVIINHELWHLANNPDSGLTDQEKKWLNSRHNLLERIQQEISDTLGKRLDKNA